MLDLASFVDAMEDIINHLLLWRWFEAANFALYADEDRHSADQKEKRLPRIPETISTMVVTGEADSLLQSFVSFTGVDSSCLSSEGAH